MCNEEDETDTQCICTNILFSILIVLLLFILLFVWVVYYTNFSYKKRKIAIEKEIREDEEYNKKIKRDIN